MEKETTDSRRERCNHSMGIKIILLKTKLIRGKEKGIMIFKYLNSKSE